MVLLPPGQINPTIRQGLFLALTRGAMFHLLVKPWIPTSMILFLHQNSLKLTNTLTWKVLKFVRILS